MPAAATTGGFAGAKRMPGSFSCQTNWMITSYRGTVIILVALKSKTVGFIVDAVSDVLQIAPEAVTPPPETGMAPEQAFLSAIARVDDRLFGLVDVDVVGNMA